MVALLYFTLLYLDDIDMENVEASDGLVNSFPSPTHVNAHAVMDNAHFFLPRIT